ncbi:unnamed protein product [Diamesa hyperborea]
MKVFVNIALVLILCFVNIASSHHAQGNGVGNGQGNGQKMGNPRFMAPSTEAPIVPVADIVVPTEANVVIPVESAVVPVNNSTTPADQSGYFAHLLQELKNFFSSDKTNSTVAEPSAPIVETVVLA